MSEPAPAPDEIPAETPVETPEPPTQPVGTPGEQEESVEEEERLATPEEAQAVPPEWLSQKELEKRLDRLAREAERHTARVREIMDEDVVLLVPCAMCETIIPGFVMAGSFNEERRQQVRVFLGDKKPRELRKDPHSTVCEVCGGEGQVDTDSKVPGYDVVPCSDCGGKGVVGERFTQAAPPPIATGATATATPPNGPSAPGPQQLDPATLAVLKEKGYMAMPVAARP